MAYITISDVSYFFTTNFNSNSEPTADQVTAFITEMEGVLNMAMEKAGIDVPPTDANVLLWCKNIARCGVLYMLDQVIYSKTTGNDSERGKEWKKQWDDALEMIRVSPSKIGGPTNIDYGMDDIPEDSPLHEDFVPY